jgi:type IV pilus assembly protein PilA
MKTLRKNQKGFTLIELMIVVGIIGILVTIAAPNFSRYQSKARQSEAKIAMSAVYGAEKSFYSEYAAYMGSMDAIGYAPEGNKRFYEVGWSPGAPPANAVSGYAGSEANQSWTQANDSFSCGGVVSNPAVSAMPNPQTFLVGASGCVRNGQSAYDNWIMNDTKVLSNNQISL